MSFCYFKLPRLRDALFLGAALLTSASLNCTRLPAQVTTSQQPQAAEVLVRVNRAPVTAAELQFDFYIHQIPQADRESRRQELIERLIDRLLIEQFLSKKKLAVSTDEIDRQVDLVKRVIELRGGTFEATLAEAGLTEPQLRKMLTLPLLWKQYVEQTVTEQQVVDYFQAHRRELDGTKLTGAQIVKVVPAEAPDEDWVRAEQELRAVRDEIVAGKITFGDAAKKHSDSPSAQAGGDLGKFEYTGRLPVDITRVAFAQKPGEVSPVFRTRFGVHLVSITSEIPGQLSAEDVRPQILDVLGNELWSRQVQVERSRATVEWPTATPSGRAR